MKENSNIIFLSHSSDDAFEACMLQFAFEELMKDLEVKVWAYRRDQNKDEREIAKSLKEQIKNSKATIFLVSPSTLDSNATQWMELAYSDAYGIPTFVLLHHLTYQELKNKTKGVPPLLFPPF